MPPDTNSMSEALSSPQTHGAVNVTGTHEGRESPESTREQQTQLAFVDAMRGIAVLMVIFVHTAQRIPDLSRIVDRLAQYCQMGVQLFFFVSAYTLCLSYERRRGEPNGVCCFYIRRYFRIAPLYYIAILSYMSFAQVLVPLARIPLEIDVGPYTIRNVLANMSFVHWCVPSANNNIVPGGWSIGTEMAFYLIFPLLFEFVRRVVAGGVYRLIVFICVVTVANIGIEVLISTATHYSIYNNSFMYFSLINQLPVFMIGFLAFYTAHPSIPLASGSVASFLFILFTAIALACWRQQTPLYFSVIPTISGASFFFLLELLRNFRFQHTVIAALGQVSFSMYIFHFFFAWGLVPFIVKAVGIYIQSDLLFVSCFLAVSGLTYIIAVFTWRKIEVRGIIIGNRIVGCLKAA